MKRAFLCIVLAACILILCADSQPAAEQLLVTSLAPLEFASFEALSKAIGEVQSKQETSFTMRNAHLIQDYRFDKLSYYYVPAAVPPGTQLKVICVKDLYLAIYYTLDISLLPASGVKGARVDERLSTITFGWTRFEDGALLHKNTIEQLQLQPWEGDPEVYYDDIDWIPARQFYWVQDGFCFTLAIPLSVFSEDIPLRAVKVEPMQ